MREITLYIIAGLCEIGGGYLIWQWLKEEKSIFLGIIGAIIMVVYGIIATFQTSNFGKVYAVYGGFFIIMSLIWA